MGGVANRGDYNPRMIRTIAVAAMLLCWVCDVAEAQRTLSPPTDRARELALLVRNLDKHHRLLYVTAHPDDEDARLLAKLRYKQGVETALLTLTRGEGGQNEIGPELFDAIGVLRSRELEAAGAYTGVQQFFSSAWDFGYSFSKEETFEKWGREKILKEIVQRIREFRPDVVLTMLTDPEGGGQHHQASAELTAEAYHVAGTKKWPELGKPHQVQRLFRQVWDDRELPNVCEVPLNEYDPVLGCTYVQLGRQSRAQHKCQGMARLTATRGVTSRWQWLHGGDAAPKQDLFEGVSSLDNRFSDVVQRVQRTFNVEAPEACLPVLAQLWDAIEGEYRIELGSQPVEMSRWQREEKIDPTLRARFQTLRQRCARAIFLSTGVQVELTTDSRWLSPGMLFDVKLSAAAARVPCNIRVGFGGRSQPVPQYKAMAQGLAFGLKPGEESSVRVQFQALSPPDLLAHPENHIHKSSER